jgi:uncharacterized membrane protein YecN with MAPEG domain
MSNTVVVCIALMGILLFLLGANVTRNRAVRGAGNQQPTDPADVLLVAVRAHGNAAEYIPTLAVLLLVCSSLTDGWWLNTLAIAALAARVMHGAGMIASKSMANRTVPKDLGAMLTYVVGVALGVTALVCM